LIPEPTGNRRVAEAGTHREPEGITHREPSSTHRESLSNPPGAGAETVRDGHETSFELNGWSPGSAWPAVESAMLAGNVRAEGARLAEAELLSERLLVAFRKRSCRPSRAVVAEELQRIREEQALIAAEAAEANELARDRESEARRWAVVAAALRPGFGEDASAIVQNLRAEGFEPDVEIAQANAERYRPGPPPPEILERMRRLRERSGGQPARGDSDKVSSPAAALGGAEHG
jgi:hypothetical protein